MKSSSVTSFAEYFTRFCRFRWYLLVFGEMRCKFQLKLVTLLSLPQLHTISEEVFSAWCRYYFDTTRHLRIWSMPI